MKYVVLLILVFQSNYIFSQEESVTSPQIAIRVHLGETVKLDDVSITFSEILEDSRCPTNVDCIWAGRAHVVLIVKEEGEKAITKEVFFGQVLKDEKKDMVLLLRPDFTIEAMNIAPYPKEPGEKLDYFIRIRKLHKN